MAAAGEAVAKDDALSCGEALLSGLGDPPPLAHDVALAHCVTLCKGVFVPSCAPLLLCVGVGVAGALAEALSCGEAVPQLLPLPVPPKTLLLPDALAVGAAEEVMGAEAEALD